MIIQETLYALFPGGQEMPGMAKEMHSGNR